MTKAKPSQTKPSQAAKKSSPPWINQNGVEAWLKGMEFMQDATNRCKWTLTIGGSFISVMVDAECPTKSAISYPVQLHHIGHKSVQSFSRPENAVVLECVVRLLKKGYSPTNIELEKTWKSGHGHSGRLDILVYKTSGRKKTAFGMIECKQWGHEYTNERNNMLDDGGQLFSYGINEPTTKFLMLYASTVDKNGVVKFTAEQVDYGSLVKGNQSDVFDDWNKSFTFEGFLSDAAPLYDGNKKNIVSNRLLDLDEASGQGLFNSFAEILRRHAVSDKSNAFNKIFNLFVCKICDEDGKSSTEELDFQWKVSDSNADLIDERLTTLYKKGLKDYLQISVEDAFFSSLAEFSFIDVYDHISYERNASIIREVVELLQQYRIKYLEKHQFLGDFFEDLLNTGVKQEAGQFFTPTVLARFFIKSLPLKEMMDGRIEEKAVDIIPTVIDHACGAGHFLTEAISEMQSHINGVNANSLTRRTKQKFDAHKDHYYWAREYVYGIEKDYRLAKTTKVAMFLYGDGDAVIVNGDGLDDFSASKTYANKLKAAEDNCKQIEAFDVVVSNPPFSIAGFRDDIKNATSNFALAQYAGSRSSEIECFFIERTAQLLRDGGVSGLILPLSILNSERSIYCEARKLLLIEFQIVGLVELGNKTFKATNTSTVGLFLKKRQNEEVLDAIEALAESICGPNKPPEPTTKNQGEADRRKAKNARQAILKPAIKSALDISAQYHLNDEALTKYATDWLSRLWATNSEVTDLHKIAIGMDNDFAYALAHVLNYKRQIVIAYAGEKKDQDAFLGYRYSTSRGKEEFELFRESSGHLKSDLYDEQQPNNPAKVNAHLLAAFNGASLPTIPAEIKSSLAHMQLSTMFTKTGFIIDNPSGKFSQINHKAVASNSPFGDLIDTVPLQKFSIKNAISTGQITYITGVIYEKSSEVPRPTDKRIITASNLSLEAGKIALDGKLVYLKPDFVLPAECIPKAGDIIISNASGSIKHLGKVVQIETDIPGYAIGGFLGIIRCKDKHLAKALYYRLCSKQFRLHVAKLKGQNINNLNLDGLTSFDFQLPVDLSSFYKEMSKKEKELDALRLGIANLKAPSSGAATTARKRQKITRAGNRSV